MLEKISNACCELLQSSIHAIPIREYISSRISERSQKEFKIGYFPDSSNLHLLLDFCNSDQLLKSGLFYYKNIDGEMKLSSFLENYNMILPYRNAYSKIVALVGRTILSEEKRKKLGYSKYMNSSFKKTNNLFGLYRAKSSIVKEDCVFVVEGQFDYIQAVSSGIENCVCLGSSNLTFNQFSLLSRYTNNIIMLLDNDSAGITGMNKAISNYSKWGNIKKASIPDGYKDLDQFLVSEGKLAVEFIKSLT